MLTHAVYERGVVWFFAVGPLVVDGEGKLNAFGKGNAFCIPKLGIALGVSVLVGADVAFGIAFCQRR